MPKTHEPVLLHVGYIKTGTTFLQHVVFSGKFGDLELAAGAQTRAETVQNILLADDYEFHPLQVRERMEGLASVVRSRGRLPVWSEEMLLGNPPSKRYDGFSNAKKAHAIFPEAKVLITIRRQQSIALSMYKEYILSGGCLPITSFIGTGRESASYAPVLRPEFLFYDRAVRHYQSLFGKDQVLVLPLELLPNSLPQYIDLLSSFTGKALSPDISPERVHAGEAYATLALRRKLNRFIVKDPTQPGRSGLDALFDRFVRISSRLTPNSWGGRLGQNLEREVEERYAGMFLTSNQSLANITGLDLASYGYDM